MPRRISLSSLYIPTLGKRRIFLISRLGWRLWRKRPLYVSNENMSSAACAEDSKDYGDPTQTPQTMTAEWCLGFTSTYQDTVVYLSASERRVLYIVGHTGVILDIDSKEQLFLRGHTNEISSVCSSKDRSIVVTAATGPDNAMIFWDTKKASCIKIIVQPFPAGVVDVDMSPDARYVAVLSFQRQPQFLAIWDRERKLNDPIVQIELEGEEYQHSVRFNETNPNELLTNGKRRILFWKWDKASNDLECQIPAHGIDSLKKKIGSLKVSTFLPHTSKVACATSGGQLVLFDIPVDFLKKRKGREAIKAVRIGNGGALKTLNITDRYMVTGGVDGVIHFFDFNLKIVAWFEDIKAGPIQSISFAPEYHERTEEEIILEGSNDPFKCPDFLVATRGGKIVEIKAEMFGNIHAEGRSGIKVADGFEASVTSVACHPSIPEIFSTGGDSGTLRLWNTRQRVCVFQMNLGAPISAIGFHPCGKTLVVGLGNGRLQFFDLKPEKPLVY
ncbi:hypothetical protein AAMO2058_001182900 [Amorphochlora amoebiformis]